MIDAVLSSAAALVLTVGTMADAEGGRALHAHDSAPVAAVGTLMNGDDERMCTAFVVKSASHDLIMTAAHCVSGTAAGLHFVPAYDGNSRPQGTWTVTKAYAERAWVEHQDEDADYVVLEVAPRTVSGGVKNIEDVTGGLTLGLSGSGGAQPGPRIQVTGYNNADEAPIGCAPHMVRDKGYPAFQCGGFSSGTSGSPWVVETRHGGKTVDTVRGLTSGYKQGGCSDNLSYSAPLTSSTRSLVARAEAGGTGDTMPSPADPGC